MLEARQFSEDYIYEQEPVITRKVIKRKVKSRKKRLIFAQVLVVGIILLAVVIGLMIAGTHAQITYRDSNIIQIKKEISDLQNANERLQLEIARMKSPNRIQGIATAELGMIKPGISNIKYVAVDKTGQDSEHVVANQGVSEAAVESLSDVKVHPVVLSVNKMINRYAYDL